MQDRLIGPEKLSDSQSFTLHANAVSVGGLGLLIIGPSGSGKSALSLELMALGAQLIADDRTILSERDGQIIARAPDTIKGKIEARGLGILNADTCDETGIAAVLDMEHIEKDRLPPLRHCRILGVRLPLFYRVETVGFAAAVMQYLKCGRSA